MNNQIGTEGYFCSNCNIFYETDIHKEILDNDCFGCIITSKNNQGNISSVSFKINIYSRKKTRQFTISLGANCIVKPINLHEKKHRDRHVTVRRIVDTPSGVVAHVEFKDNHQMGVVKIYELIPFIGVYKRYAQRG